ncbi:hypothetical protein CROQUDRAFT_89753 [Cronartium quercuum f. sp. fusiforme G11]|uniref:Uncharacterized protein n=1 Tax=Cronartium quercuum f. sp. fusiforme G11 TaxID=708437 RepID=A0A9P6NSX2_9BASI|nr:hypothetical protein CROQUDRAFT_89753 [Cronartium quercuum f. sp. fusiforme G11]
MTGNDHSTTRRGSLDSHSKMDPNRSPSSSNDYNSGNPVLRRLDNAGDLWRTRDGNVIYWHGHKLHYDDLSSGVWAWSASGGEHARKKLVTEISHEKKPKHEKRVGLSDFVSPYRHKLLDEHTDNSHLIDNERTLYTQIQRTYGDLYLIATSWKEVINFLQRPQPGPSSSGYHQKLGELESKLRFYIMVSLREYDGLPLDPSRPGRASWPTREPRVENELSGWDIVKIPFSKSSASSENCQSISHRNSTTSISEARSSSVPHRGRRKSAHDHVKTDSANVNRTRSNSLHTSSSRKGASANGDRSDAMPSLKSKGSSGGRIHRQGDDANAKKKKSSSSQSVPSLWIDIVNSVNEDSEDAALFKGGKSKRSHRRPSQAKSQEKEVPSNRTPEVEKSHQGSTKAIPHDKKRTSNRADDKNIKPCESVSSKANRSGSKHRETIAISGFLISLSLCPIYVRSSRAFFQTLTLAKCVPRLLSRETDDSEAIGNETNRSYGCDRSVVVDSDVFGPIWSYGSEAQIDRVSREA